ncbi:GTP 3',8-cyclase MoaA [Paenibacillus silvae]|uniref:GTP 3',8-cyclase MoaA n=1 Tax=Paenibacillus silvae TaxID=1325358 RepID=UPI0020067D3B|nr:GTP 3',8-cyclase MoaA [Paenibacillus silvae]MCK6076657.1 GTP 3',8-cyclase MoaA [Paenibacillus silvae]MCK6151084.1 GTP 3',8-cyclase MoaA [Paenibacillus silvae]MCK6269343.1 GTP 3',8-cyclase MoaA [Paenibacillus silvae]
MIHDIKRGDRVKESILQDRFGRKHDYLRISVTDKCNLSCVYCMPEEGMEFEPEEKLLSDDEIVEVVTVAARMGIRKLRITGGEPLVRKNLDQLISRLTAIPGIEDTALTTNGIFLAAKAEKLRAAGVTRINISLDSMRADRFRLITRGGDVRKVLAALEASIRVGFDPIKINVVLMKGINDDEIDDFLALTLNSKLTVRFIEYMPIGHESKDWRSRYLPLSTVLERCQALGMSYGRINEVYGNGPSENYQIAGAQGSFGLIHPVSDHFCSNCNRLRLTADGMIKPCLYWNYETYVRPAIGQPEMIERLFRETLAQKPETHEMAKALANQERSHQPTVRRMSQIGG